MQLERMLKAFRLAYQAAECELFDSAARSAFRLIAFELWQALGKPRTDEVT